MGRIIKVIWNNAQPPFSTSLYRSYMSSNTSLIDESENVVRLTWTGGTGGGYSYTARIDGSDSPTVVLNHVYYLSYMINPSVDNQQFGIEFAGGQVLNYGVCPANEWTQLRFRALGRRNGAGVAYFGNRRDGTAISTGFYILLKSPIYVDLTTMYGAGKEPSIEEFEMQCALNGIDLTQGQAKNDGTERDWIIPEATAEMVNRKRQILIDSPHIATANSGSFTTDVVAPLKSLRVDFEPAQSGIGDPLPTNVRAISGWTGATLSNGGQSQTISWSGSAGIVYGGYVDLVSGTMTVTRAYIEYDGSSDENWEVENVGGHKNFYINIPDASSSYNVICNVAKPREGSFDLGDCMISARGYLNLYIGSLIGETTVSGFRTWLSAHTVQVAYLLKSPQSVSIPPSVIKALRGANSFSAAGMTVTSATYWTH